MSEKQINHSQRFGIILVLSCGIMWGISGVLGQYVFQSSDVNATQLSIIRQFISGVVLLVIAAVKGDKRALTIWSKPKKCHIYAVLCTLRCHGRAVHILRFHRTFQRRNRHSDPVHIHNHALLLYTTIFMHKRPHIYEAASVVCAFAGIFLIATHGGPEFPCHIQAGAHMGTHLSGMFHYILPLSSEALQ